MKKKFWSHDRSQVDGLLTDMDKEKEQQLLSLKQEITNCLRHNYELIQEIEKIVRDIESNQGWEHGDRLEKTAAELRALHHKTRIRNQEMEKITSSLGVVLDSYISNGKLPSPHLEGKGTGKLIYAAIEDEDNAKREVITLDPQVIPDPEDVTESIPTAEKPYTIPRVLVTDDDDTIRAVVKLMLEREGYEVIEAKNGREAFQMIEQASPPDIIILDLMLPYVDGLQVIKKIRSHPEWKRVPVIMLSANASEKDVVNLFKAGANDYVTKPFNPRELVARVNANLRKTLWHQHWT